MFVEERCYTLRPGSVPEYLDLYERRGMAAQARYLPDMLGYYSSELGDLNEVVHLWAHHSLDIRERNRQAMRSDPEFQAYWQEVRVLVVGQRTRVLRPAPFFAGRLMRMVEAGRASTD